jgi:CheY-like chemotaxis protein
MNRLNILLAEDNPGDILLVREALAEHRIEHELHVVTDGEQALQFIAQMGRPAGIPCPDLFLLDINLPKADGPTVLQAFRKHSECEETPVIVVTSSDTVKERAQLTALGISHYFRKPLDLAGFMALGSVIRQVMADPVETE